MSIITFRIAGDLVDLDNHITARTLIKSVSSIQSAVDRAYLDIKYDGVWKHARLKSEDYLETEFIVLDPRDGSFVLDLKGVNAQAIVNVFSRIKSALKPAYDNALNAADDDLVDQLGEEAINRRIVQLDNKILRPVPFEAEKISSSQKIKRAYGDRSIVKEIDNGLSLIRHESAGESTFELSLATDSTEVFKFDKKTAVRFHRLISQKELGDLYIYRGHIRMLDRGADLTKIVGKFINAENKKTLTLHISNPDHYFKLAKYQADDVEFTFVGCPMIEYGSFDPNAGDVYTIEV